MFKKYQKKASLQYVNNEVRYLNDTIVSLENRMGHLPNVRTGEAQDNGNGWISSDPSRPTTFAERILAIEKYLGVGYSSESKYAPMKAKKVSKKK